MPKSRYLAPWHQPDLWETLDGEELSAEALRDLKGKPAIYHCISRVVDRRFVLKDVEKEQFVSFMRIYEEFCQVHVLAFCVMSNHFHILLEVPMPPEDRGASWSDAKLLKHLRCLYSGAELKEIKWELEHLRELENKEGAERLRNKFFRRMWDLSAYMQSLKRRFSQWYNLCHDRHGTLWEERFKSVLVESGLAARAVAGYIDLNPVRAGIVKEPQDYRWCSFGEAVAGRKLARQGLQRVMFERAQHATSVELAAEMLLDWRKASRLYRQILNADLQRGKQDAETAMAETPNLSEGEMLRQRVRHFTDGLVIGTKRFVEDVFAATRSHFGPKRKTGARRMRGVDIDLCSMRDLQKQPQDLGDPGDH